MTKMFKEVTKTWSPIVGCLFGCKYCYARRLAEGRLRHLPRYADGFKPRVVDSKMFRRFRSGLVFVGSMGDMWGDWVMDGSIQMVLDAVWESPNATFLFLTKNPKRYLDFDLPVNSIAGVTIETNYDTGDISKAPTVFSRYLSFSSFGHRRRFVSIEPIMNFSMNIMVQWIKSIAPEFVYIGYDGYPWRNHLPEPSLKKTRDLISELNEFTEVRIKTLREGR